MPEPPSPEPPSPTPLAEPRDRDGPARVVAFDLDGTLTWADSLVMFLRAREPKRAFRRRARSLAPAGLAYLLGRSSRDVLKERLVTRFLAGAPAEAARREAAAFWESEAGGGLLRADALAALRAHRAAGEAVAIVTACPELVAGPLADRLGAACLGSPLEIRDGRLTGRLGGANCRGPEKVRRLRSAYGDDVVITAAYGDSRGDREMLAAAEAPRFKAFLDGPRLGPLAAARLWL